MTAITRELTRWRQGNHQFRLLGQEYLTMDGRETQVESVQVLDSGTWIPVNEVL